MEGTSLNITDDLIKRLKEIIPAAFTEDKINVEQLRQLIGEAVNTDTERYQLNWAGKNDAYKVLQTPTTATLIPNLSDSINWDNADNVFIEGENLEVLKTLQKSYYGKVKVVCIDPPYNTGSDSFIYPDKFSETREDYLKRINEKDDEGFLMKEGVFRKNSKENGQFHSNWLSMMLPRLFIARNLLKDDGILFISIDDNEQANLKLLCDEIFGAENFVSQFIWRKKAGGGNDSDDIAVEHEYILCYKKFINGIYKLPLDAKTIENYKYSDEKVSINGKYSLKDLNDPSLSDSSGLHYDILCPDGSILSGDDNQWKCNQETFQKRLNDNRIVFTQNKNGDWKCYYKIYLNEEKGILKIDKDGKPLQKGKNPNSLLYDIGLNKSGNDDIKKLFKIKPFDYPKPVKLIKHLLQMSTNKNSNDLVVDFFSGSGTLGQAVLEQNYEDNGNRKFICIQLNEPIKDESLLKNTKYKTIADISIDRIKKVIQLIQEDKNSKIDFNNNSVIGVRAFKLADSNFKIWNKEFDNSVEELTKQIEIFREISNPNSTAINYLWELVLKNGFSLSTRIEVLKEGDLPLYYLPKESFLFYFDDYNESISKKVQEIKPKCFISLDSIFKGNDSVKTNLILKLEQLNISYKSI
jgi:adenine-specific DNA-methyltransferase